MAKIKPYANPNYLLAIHVVVNHWWYEDPFEPHAYHTIYAYRYEDMPLGGWADAWQQVFHVAGEDYDLTFARGLMMAKAWVQRPWMVEDICLSCRFYSWGPGAPRWNIYRGEPHFRLAEGVSDYPLHLIPGFFQPWDDPPPPGYA